MGPAGPQPDLFAVALSREITSSLRERGCDVDAAESAARCVEGLREGSYDAVVLAEALPDANGPDVVERLRATAPEAAIVVVGEATGSVACRLLAAGATAFISRSEDTAPIEDRVFETVVNGDETDAEVRNRYRELIETSPVAINLFDAAGETIYGNDAVLDLLGLDDRSELVGQSIFEFVHPDHRETARSE